MSFDAITIEVFSRTFAHSFLSTAMALFLGVLGGMGIAGVYRFQKTIRLLSILPAVLPSLFIVTSILNLIRPFPFGMGAIVGLHVLLNVGLVSIAVADLIQSQTQGYSDVCRLLNVGRWKYLTRVMLPSLSTDLFRIAMTVFIFCFTSFSVPILVGGSAMNSIEALIYQKVRVDQNLSMATWLSLAQVGLLVGLTFIGRSKAERDSSAGNSRSYMEKGDLAAVGPFVILPIAASLFIFVGLVRGLLAGLNSGAVQTLQGSVYSSAVLEGLAGTIAIGVLTAALMLAIYSAILLLLPQRSLQFWLRVSVSPSPVLLGVLFLILLGWLRGRFSLAAADSILWTGFFEIPFIALCSSIAFFPALWRMSLASAWDRVSGQVDVASLMGAGRFLIFRRIVWPQVRPQLAYVAGLASFWSVGDFALSSLLSDRDISLGIVIQNLLGSYRVELATTLMWVLLVVGVAIMLLVWGLGYVQDKED